MDVNLLDPQFPYYGPPRKKMTKVVFFSLLLGGLMLGTTWAGARAFGTNSLPPTMSTSTAVVAPLTFWDKVKQLIVSGNRTLRGTTEDRINVALFGVGGEGHDGSQLTDTILVASFQPSTKQVALISIPRDTVVNMPTYGWRKINEANALNEMDNPGTGTAAATAVLEDFLGIEIPYFFRVDFQGFAEIIDNIGGVDVYVDKPFTDYQFPDGTDGVRAISFAAGWTNMDGSTALDFARSRHGNNFEGSDFARARRQQKIIVAARDKILSSETLLHPMRIVTIIRSLDKHLQTNLGVNDLLELARLGKEVDTATLINVVLSDDPSSVLVADESTGAFYLRPRDPTLQAIHLLVQNIFNEQLRQQTLTVLDSTPLKPSPHYAAKIEVQNGTWRPGFAAREKKKLERDNFTVTFIGNAALRPVTTAQIFDVTGKYPQVVEKLLKRYNAVMITNRPPPSPDTPGSGPVDVDLVVVLGENVPDIAE